MPAFNNYNAYGVYPGYIAPVNNWGNTQTYQPQQIQQVQQPSDYREFVHGRAGAEAYQLKNGATMQVLWDDETDRFYIKGYDNNGRPRVLADNDFQQHIDPDPVQMPTIDLTPYATKDDLQKMIDEAFDKIQQNNSTKPNLSAYVTKTDLNKILNSLSVGNGGRIVRDNESNA